MKNKKVEYARFHVGLTFARGTLLTLESKKHESDIELTPTGIFVSMNGVDKKVYEYFVPHTNIHFVSLKPDDGNKTK